MLLRFADWRTIWKTLLLFDAQYLAVPGPAGDGKTHTLAEIVTGYEKTCGCVLFVEGRAFHLCRLRNEPIAEQLRRSSHCRQECSRFLDGEFARCAFAE